ncbi:hypothetical protein KAU32_05700 [bacterium]|nr:hypothetical protein [bacterium]
MKKILLAALILIVSALAFGDRINKLVAVVNIEVTTPKESTVSEGRLFYFDYKILLEVTAPIQQKMFFSENTLSIYYPASKKAFLFRSRITQTFPLFAVLLMTVEDDLGLTQLGFKLERTEKKKHGKVFVFVPENEMLRKELESYEVEIDGDGLVTSIRVFAKGRRLVSETAISDYKETGNLKLPHFINTIKYDAKGNVVTSEKMTMDSIIVNAMIPKRVKEFSLPEGAEVEEIDW